MPARPRSLRLATGASLAAAAALALGACGADEPDTVLAIDQVAWVGNSGTELQVTTECARDVEAVVGADDGGSELPQITITGTPVTGRCHPSVTVTLPAGTAKVVDAATSAAVDLPTNR